MYQGQGDYFDTTIYKHNGLLAGARLVENGLY